MNITKEILEFREISKLFPQLSVALKALALLIAGYIVGNLAAFATRLILENMLGLEGWIKKKKLKSVLKLHPSNTAALLVKWYVYLAFILSAVQLFGKTPILLTIQSLFSYYPKLVGAIILYVVGRALAEVARKSYAEQDVIADILYLGILGVFLLSAIQTMGFNIQPILLFIFLFVGSFLVTLGIAFGIGIGLALKDILKPYLKKYIERWLSEQ